MTMIDWFGLTPAEALREYNTLFMARDFVALGQLSKEVGMMLARARLQAARDKHAEEQAWQRVVRSEPIAYDVPPRYIQLALTVTGTVTDRLTAGYNAGGELIRCTVHE